ncbi:hypothetical protein ACHAXR_003143 [Thalassiosira sp. AJA248-18]
MDKNAPPPVAIIGASYAGLTLANVLHLHSIPYVIFDCKSLPFTHVMGGAKFNIPSYELIVKKLELVDVAKSYLDDDDDDGPTREEVIESLLQRVGQNLITSQRIVRIESRSSGLFYLHALLPKTHEANQSDDQIIGPFQSIVGADGVLSKVRTSALLGTFLIGDARWVNDRWYDLGLRRINRGADMALLDGLALGEAMVSEECGRIITKQKTTVVLSRIREKFCAWEISQRRAKRRCTLFVAILFTLMFKFQHECCSILHKMAYILKDSIFRDDCLSHHDRTHLNFMKSYKN